jgi:hypothetical protein
LKLEAGTETTGRLELLHGHSGSVRSVTGQAKIDGDAILLSGLPQDAAQIVVDYELVVDVLDGALADHYRDHLGKAARVSDLLDSIRVSTGFDAQPLADTWLRAANTPAAMP